LVINSYLSAVCVNLGGRIPLPSALPSALELLLPKALAAAFERPLLSLLLPLFLTDSKFWPSFSASISAHSNIFSKSKAQSLPEGQLVFDIPSHGFAALAIN
jgi:hypothetical protein